MDRVIVGIDGSESSARALRWALSFAGARSITAFHSATLPYSPTPAAGRAPLTLPDPDDVREESFKLLRGWVEEFVPAASDEIDLEARVGPPAHELLARAESADLLVVGSRGLGGFRGLLLGSVSRQCLSHASGPLVIVPDRGDAQFSGREIVVGLDGSAASHEALRWAAEAAQRAGGVVTALHVVDTTPHVGMYAVNVDEDVLTGDELAEEIGEIARDTVGEVADEVVVEVAAGHPAEVILERAEGADLLVLGSRGMGGFKRLLVGSVSHQCATHAPCPVAVIRTAADEA